MITRLIDEIKVMRMYISNVRLLELLNVAFKKYFDKSRATSFTATSVLYRFSARLSYE